MKTFIVHYERSDIKISRALYQYLFIIRKFFGRDMDQILNSIKFNVHSKQNTWSIYIKEIFYLFEKFV